MSIYEGIASIGYSKTVFSALARLALWYGALILQKFFVFYCFVLLLSGLYHDPKTTIEKNGVIWGAYRRGERVVLSHF